MGTTKVGTLSSRLKRAIFILSYFTNFHTKGFLYLIRKTEIKRKEIKRKEFKSKEEKEIEFSPFVVSALIALLIALLTVSYQSIKAATANPVDSLRYE